MPLGQKHDKGALPLTARVFPEPQSSTCNDASDHLPSASSQANGTLTQFGGWKYSFLPRPNYIHLVLARAQCLSFWLVTADVSFPTAQTRNRRNSLILGPRKFCLGGWLSVASHHIWWWWLTEGGNPNTEQ